MSEALQIVPPSLFLFAGYWWLTGWTEWPRARTACFAAGLVAIGLGVAVDDISLPLHMAGHGVIVAVGAPLIVLSRPVTLLLRSLPKPAARDLAAALRSPRLRRLLWPPLAFAAFAAGQVAFHWTPLFWDSLREEGLHVAEHAIFLLTALWFWSVCLAVEPLPGRWDPWARAGLLMAAMTASDSGGIKLMVDGYGSAGVAMLASMLPLGLGAAGVAWTAMVREERRAGKAIVHVPG